MEDFQSVVEKLSNFKNLYDVLRFIDHVNKRTIVTKCDVINIEDNYCYEFWEKQTFCDNCISMRAFLEKDTCVKIEIINSKVMLIIASPVSINGKEYIVEMLKDISKGSEIVKDDTNIKNINEFIDILNDKVIKDELTNIYNKRYINERLPVDIAISINENMPISLIMTDIDFFKNVNDTYGHVIGDNVLRDFAALINSSIRTSTDWVGRYGGEEFLIVLNNTNSENAFKVAEKIRASLENAVFEYGNIRISITASFGVYEIDDKNYGIDKVIACADKNLYIAKKTDRNKTVV